ncbi:uncharacterized protein IL334_005191 [Kwoniella shivajii]|uniref:Uncharacterized protein n=1 Tax=Kwoniella shivajii TaxID=564305 RepID=A0ABZ1D2F9_9TREE|nr:hypothetical protein IL334_005191 [Kwoniella shivajii]
MMSANRSTSDGTVSAVQNTKHSTSSASDLPAAEAGPSRATHTVTVRPKITLESEDDERGSVYCFTCGVDTKSDLPGAQWVARHLPPFLGVGSKARDISERVSQITKDFQKETWYVPGSQRSARAANNAIRREIGEKIKELSESNPDIVFEMEGIECLGPDDSEGFNEGITMEVDVEVQSRVNA